MKKGWLWSGALIIPILFLIDAFLYYPALLESGTLDTNTDSIAIPLVNALFGSPVLTLFLILYALPALWGYRSNARFLDWDNTSSIRMALSVALYALPAILLIGEQIYALSRALPYYEYFDSIFILPLIGWALMLRAAMVAPRIDDGTSI